MGEVAEQAELERRQVDGPPVPHRAEPAGVDVQVADGEHRRAVAAGPAEQRADPRHQLLHVERLGQVVVGAGIDALDALRQALRAGQHQDRRRDALGAEPLQDREAVELRQAQVEDDRIVVLGAAAEPGVLAVASRPRRRSRAEVSASTRSAAIDFVLDDQDTHQRSLTLTMRLRSASTVTSL